MSDTPEPEFRSPLLDARPPSRSILLLASLLSIAFRAAVQTLTVVALLKLVGVL